MSIFKGFTDRQRASLDKALNYCHGTLSPETIIALQKMVDLNRCDYLDCNLICDKVFLVAYGKRGLFVDHKQQEAEQQEAIKDLDKIVLKYAKQSLCCEAPINELGFCKECRDNA